MDNWRSKQNALLAALVIEAEINERRFHHIRDLSNKYGISLNILDLDTVLKNSAFREFLEHPSIVRKDEYRLAGGMLESVKTIILKNFRGHFLFVDPAAKKIVTDSPLSQTISLPQDWTFGEIDSDISAAADWNEIDDMMGRLDNARAEEVYIDRADPKFERAVQSLETLSTAIVQSNSASSYLKDDFEPILRNSIEILRKSKKVTVGLVKFLILDRLKEAYKDASEEFLKDLIKFSFFALSLYFLGLIG